MQIFADVFGLPASRTVVNGAASLGSAICAAVAVGAHESYDEAMNKMVRTRDSFMPDSKNHALYTRMNEEVYKSITRYTDEVLKKSYPIFG